MNTRANPTSRTYEAVLQQGRMWQRYARILDEALRRRGSRLWVKPLLHAEYGLRQTRMLRARTFVLTTRLEGGNEETLQRILEENIRPHEALRTRRTGDSLTLSTRAGHLLGKLNRPAWSWIGPLVELGYEPTFYLREITVHEGRLTANVVVAHFHEGVESYLMEHYRERAEAALA